MIYGIGTDIAAIVRLQGLWDRHGKMAAAKVLAPAELADFAAARDKGRFLAKRFAAKEAFAKAFGTGLRAPVTLPNLAVIHDKLGKPAFVFAPELATVMTERGLIAHLSISDEKEHAIAFVIVETA